MAPSDVAVLDGDLGPFWNFEVFVSLVSATRFLQSTKDTASREDLASSQTDMFSACAKWNRTSSCHVLFALHTQLLVDTVCQKATGSI